MVKMICDVCGLDRNRAARVPSPALSGRMLWQRLAHLRCTVSMSTSRIELSALWWFKADISSQLLERICPECIDRLSHWPK
jgi:hypothetical protein